MWIIMSLKASPINQILIINLLEAIAIFKNKFTFKDIIGATKPTKKDQYERFESNF